MAVCVIAVVGVAPCQCFSPGANQTTSPGRIFSIGVALALNPAKTGRDNQRLTEWIAPRTRAGSGASNSGSMRTVPVNQSAGPLVELCEPHLFIFIFDLSSSIFPQLVAFSSRLRADMPLRLISIY